MFKVVNNNFDFKPSDRGTSAVTGISGIAGVSGVMGSILTEEERLLQEERKQTIEKINKRNEKIQKVLNE